jgi:hypothetical protein
VKTSAQFDIGLLGLSFTYFLKLTREPKYNTFTWAMDYSRNSDLGTIYFHRTILPKIVDQFCCFVLFCNYR